MPIRFDDAAADQLVRELVVTARSVQLTLSTIEASLPVVTQDWAGRLRERFDRSVEDQRLVLANLLIAAGASAVGVRALQLAAEEARRAELAALPPILGPDALCEPFGTVIRGG